MCLIFHRNDVNCLKGGFHWLHVKKKLICFHIPRMEHLKFKPINLGGNLNK